MQLSWKGTYTLGVRYRPGDVVYHVDDGFTYVCIRETYNIPPYIYDSGFELLAGFNVTLLDGGEF